MHRDHPQASGNPLTDQPTDSEDRSHAAVLVALTEVSYLGDGVAP